MTKSVRFAFVLAAGFALSGCKLWIVSPPGGDVQVGTLFVLYRCDGGSVCEVEIDDPGFSRTYTAVPQPGYEFVQWLSADGYLCGGSTNPECTVALDGGVIAQAIVNTFEIAHIAPVYRDVGVDTDGDGVRNEQDEDDDNDGYLDVDDDCPLVAGTTSNGCLPLDIVVYDQTNWAQVDLFAGVTWSQAQTACPPPSNQCTGGLNGYDVRNYVWASVDDMNALFNDFIPSPADHLGPGPDGFTPLFGDFADSFFSLGWRPTSEQFFLRVGTRYYLDGLVSDDAGSGSGSSADASHCPGCTVGGDSMETNGVFPVGSTRPGAWLYEQP